MAATHAAFEPRAHLKAAIRAERLGRLHAALEARVDLIDINGAAYNPLAPFGDYMQSGNGRELGRSGLDEFLEIKAIQR